VYQPLEAERLTEIAMHAMDTLYFIYYLDCPRKATSRLAEMTDISQFGGCFTSIGMDRSLAPKVWALLYWS